MRSLDSAVIEFWAQVDKQVSQPFAWASFNVEHPSFSGAGFWTMLSCAKLIIKSRKDAFHFGSGIPKFSLLVPFLQIRWGLPCLHLAWNAWFLLLCLLLLYGNCILSKARVKGLHTYTPVRHRFYRLSFVWRKLPGRLWTLHPENVHFFCTRGAHIVLFAHRNLLKELAQINCTERCSFCASTTQQTFRAEIILPTEQILVSDDLPSYSWRSVKCSWSSFFNF